MIKKLLWKIRLTSFFFIILSIASVALTVFVWDDSNFIEKILSVLFTVIFGLLFIVKGIKGLTSADRKIKSYINKTGYTYDELDNELEFAEDFSPVYVGTTHVFIIDDDKLPVIPLRKIEELSIFSYDKAKYDMERVQALSEKVNVDNKIDEPSGRHEEDDSPHFDIYFISDEYKTDDYLHVYIKQNTLTMDIIDAITDMNRDIKVTLA